MHFPRFFAGGVFRRTGAVLKQDLAQDVGIYMISGALTSKIRYHQDLGVLSHHLKCAMKEPPFSRF